MTITMTRPTHDDTELLRGSLITLRRRCGKPNCRCAGGDPHETPALSYSEAGTTRTLTLRDEDIPDVEAGLARYRAARDELERAAVAGLSALADRLASRRRQSRR